MSLAARHSLDRAHRRAQELRQWRQAALIALPIVGGIGGAAIAVLATLAPAQPVLVIPLPPRPDGAAALARPDLSSPGAGTTGTIALPPEPAAARRAGRADTEIATPFRTGVATAIDRGRALECLTAVIYYEAASESDDGQRAVAQVVLNRVRHPAFPATVCGVVYQGSEKPSGCQFSFACDGAMARLPSRAGWARALRIAAGALAGQVFAPVGLATHYHTYAVTPAWNRTLVMTDAIGAHFFHRWKGYWGTAAAFTRGYRGGEPTPGPHLQATPTLSIPVPTVATVAPAPMTLAATVAAPVNPPPAAPSEVQPAYAASGTLRTAVEPGTQILDKWKDSGQPRE